MRPGLPIDLPLDLLLDAVVADGLGRVERLSDLVFTDRSDDGRRRIRRPHTGVAVGLELRSHRRALGTLLIASNLVQRADQVLDVVPVLMSEHVCLRERPALGAEPSLQLLEEPEVHVHLLVGGAVERADVGGRETAARVRGVREEHGVRRTIAVDHSAPVGLDAVHGADQAAGLALLRILTRLALLMHLALLLLTARGDPIE